MWSRVDVKKVKETEREREKDRQTDMGTQALMEKGCFSSRNAGLYIFTTDWSQIGKGVRQGCILSPCFFNLYAEHIMQMPGWMKLRLESRLLGKMSITSDMQMTPPLGQKVKKN